MRRSLTRRKVLWGAAGLALARPGRARAAGFFDGKLITVICGYNPGGGADLGTRLMAENIGAHIPGSPKVIVQNMEGAGGLIAASFLAAKAAPDGLTLAVPGRSWVLKPRLGYSNARFDPLKLAYIGSSGATNAVAFIAADTGVRTAADLKAAAPRIKFGTLPSGTFTATVPRVLSVLGWPVDVVTGYPNTSRIILAIDQREVSAVYTAESSFVRRRDLLDTGRVRPVFQTLPLLPGLPTAESLVEPADRPLMALAHDQLSIGMPLVAPAGTPPERVEMLRAAFMEMTTTKAYRDHAVRIDEPIDHPISGAELETRVRALVANITPETVAAYGKL